MKQIKSGVITLIIPIGCGGTVLIFIFVFPSFFRRTFPFVFFSACGSLYYKVLRKCRRFPVGTSLIIFRPLLFTFRNSVSFFFFVFALRAALIGLHLLLMQ